MPDSIPEPITLSGAYSLYELYDPTTLAQRVHDTVEYIGPINPSTTTSYNGEYMAIEDIPSPQIRALMGYGHDPVEIHHREHLTRPDNVPWQWTPETCLVAAGIRGVWIASDHLTCPGCGLEFT